MKRNMNGEKKSDPTFTKEKGEKRGNSHING